MLILVVIGIVSITYSRRDRIDNASAEQELEIVKWSDLSLINGRYVKKFMDKGFNGKAIGRTKPSNEWVTAASIKNGLLNGLEYSYFVGGRLWTRGGYKNGEKDGTWITYYPNGQLRSKGEYKNGLREGTWVDYNQWGSKNLFGSGIYREGKKFLARKNS